MHKFKALHVFAGIKAYHAKDNTRNKTNQCSFLSTQRDNHPIYKKPVFMRFTPVYRLFSMFIVLKCLDIFQGQFQNPTKTQQPGENPALELLAEKIKLSMYILYMIGHFGQLPIFHTIANDTERYSTIWEAYC